jgi:hypothetical protein
MSWKDLTRIGLKERWVYEAAGADFQPTFPMWDFHRAGFRNFACSSQSNVAEGLNQKIMVLQNYSWQDFAVFAVLLLVLWYFALWWFYKGRAPGSLSHGSEPLPHSWENQVEQLSGGEQVMGAAKLDSGVSVVSADEFAFAETDPASGKDEKLGLVPDVQQEIKSICSLLAENDGTKEDFFSMFKVLVREQYPDVPAEYQDALSAFIREHVPFHLSSEELESLWG